jgi:dihydrofolate reductase
MGRKTFESKEINKRPLPNRTNIVITRDTLYQPEGVIVCHSLDEAIAQASKIDSNEIFIIGGGQIFAEALPRIEKLYLTIVDTEAEADVYFPDYSEFTRIVFRESRETEGLSYQFVDLERDLRSL